jgi:mannosyltransferase
VQTPTTLGPKTAPVDPRPLTRTRSTRAAEILVVVITSAMAAFVVLRHLGTKPLWVDEAVSVSVASRPLGRLLSVLPHRDANAGLYYLVLHQWLRFGHGQAWDRGVSAACFVAAAGVAAWVGTRWRGAWFGLIAGLLMATNRFLVFYGQEARPYAAAVLLAVICTAALFWNDGEPAPGPYVAATVLLLYVDLFAVLFVAAQLAAVVAVHLWRHRSLPRPLLRCWLVIAALTAPLWLIMMTVERTQIGWLGRPTLSYLELTVLHMTDGRLGLAISAALAMLAVITLARSRVQSDRATVAALAAACLAPPAMLWVFAQIVPSFVDRYVISSTVAAIGLTALGLDIVRRRAPILALLVATVLVALGVRDVAALERAPFKYENVPALVAFVAHQTEAGDAIAYGSGGLRLLVDAYRPLDAPFPEDVALAPDGQAARQHDAYAREVTPSVLASRLDTVERLWILSDPSDHGYPSSGPFASLRSALSANFGSMPTIAFPGVDVTLYVRRPPPPSAQP